MGFAAMTFVLLVLKHRNPRFKVSRVLLYVVNTMPLVCYLIGFASYYGTSKFNSNFDETYSTPSANADDLTWKFGMVISVVQMIIMAVNALMTDWYAKLLHN